MYKEKLHDATQVYFLLNYIWFHSSFICLELHYATQVLFFIEIHYATQVLFCIELHMIPHKFISL
jgi:hypothetical protein